MKPDDCAARLAGLLDAQAEICRKILEQSRRQREFVAEMREDELLSLLADKQKLIGDQQKLAGQARPCRDEWEASARLSSSPAARARVEAAWNGLRELLEAIVKIEDESQAVLQERKSRLSTDIGTVQRGKIVNKAYGGGFRPSPAARFSDRRG
ncbi:MAG: flagellar protein FlgN [Planctomycetota bacterium]|jgi:hypothetical protein|nr:flagellar protein FlgN [Planctomycetota bacterium]